VATREEAAPYPEMLDISLPQLYTLEGDYTSLWVVSDEGR